MFHFVEFARNLGWSRQVACKPGSVHRDSQEPRAMAIHLGRRLPGASCGQPGRKTGGGPAPKGRVPMRPCSRRGLPCHRRLRQCGGLLPHRFTLTRSGGRSLLCGAFPRVPLKLSVPRRALPGTVPPRSPDFPHARKRATIRPPGAGQYSKACQFRRSGPVKDRVDCDRTETRIARFPLPFRGRPMASGRVLPCG